MDEQTGQTPNEQEETTTGQAPEQASTPAVDGGETAKTDGQEPKAFDADYVRELREEAKRYRLEKKKLAEKLAEMEQQVQQAQQEREKFQAQMRELRARTAVLTTAARMGVVDPEAAWRLLDAEALEVGEDGQPQGVEEALRALVKEKPYLLGGKTSAANPASGRKGGRLTREEIEKMTPEEINARWDEVKAVLGGK